MQRESFILFPGLLAKDSPYAFKKGKRPQQRRISNLYGDEGGNEVLSDDNRDKLSWRMRSYRDIITSESRLFITVRYAIYGLYLLHVALVTAKVLLSSLELDASMLTLKLASWASFCAWMILIALNSTWMLVVGGWQYFAWYGYRVIFLHAFQGLIFILFVISINGEFDVFEFSFSDSGDLTFEYVLLLIMGLYLFIREQLVYPITAEQRLFYGGFLAEEQKINIAQFMKEVQADNPERYAQMMAATTNEDLVESFDDARIEQGISEDVPIREALEGQTLRAIVGDDFEDDAERSDDWAVVIMKLSKLVSFAPRSFRGNTKITSLEYRNLVRQYLMDYYNPQNKENQKRTLPLSSGEAFVLMLRLSFRVPCAYLYCQIPNVLWGASMAIMPMFFGKFTNNIVSGNKELAYIYFGLLLLTMVAIVPLLDYWRNAAVSSHSAKMGDSCRRSMLDGLVNGGTKYGEINGDGAIMDAFSGHLAKLEVFSIGIFSMFWSSCAVFFFSVVVSASIYPFASVLFISLGPVVLSFSYFSDIAAKCSYRQMIFDSIFANKVTSIVECRPAIRACNSGTWIQEDSADILKDVQKVHHTNFFYSRLLSVMFNFYTQIFALFILIPLGILVVEEIQQLGDFIAINSLVFTLQASIQFFGMIQSELALYSGSMQAVQKFMDKSLREKTSTLKSSRQNNDFSPLLSPLSKQLTTANLVFKYEGMDINVLENLNIAFRKGTYVVLTGGSGSGKSTILSLLMRFREPNGGSITWDGTNLFSVSLDSFRESVAVMFQKTMIYEATVRDNILFGKPERPGGVELAAKMAEIASSIRDLPNGYDTVIGGNSAGGLSGGQMQRICLARALYRRPSVLLLDEATSALDALAENAIIDTLCRLRDKQGITIVSVSHHPSTALNADQVIVLDGGSIAEEGTYDELMRIPDGIFKGLAEA